MRLVRVGVAQHDVTVAEMIEQGRQPLFEQRQPMLHAGQPAALADRLVERVLGRARAEMLAVADAEALDAVLVEQGLARRHQGDRLGAAGGALVGGIEAAHRFDLVAEEIEPDRLLLAAGKRSMIDPRTANSPASCTASLRW